MANRPTGAFFLSFSFLGTGCNLAPGVARPSWDLRFVPFHLPLKGHWFLWPRSNVRVSVSGFFLFAFSFLWGSFAGFPFRAVFFWVFSSYALEAMCVCVSTSVPKRSTYFLTKQGAHGRLDGMGQRRPIQVVVKTYLHNQKASVSCFVQPMLEAVSSEKVSFFKPYCCRPPAIQF